MTKEQLIVELETMAERMGAIVSQLDGDLMLHVSASSSGYIEAGCYTFDGNKVKAAPIRRYRCSYEGAKWEADREDACEEIN